MLRLVLSIVYVVVIVVMAIATFIVSPEGDTIYSEWWFSALWGLLTVLAVAWFLRRRVRRPSVVCLHLSFVVILAGALLTHLFSSQGVVLLHEGMAADSYIGDDGQQHPLPFTLSLDSFRVVYYEGTQMPADYQSFLTLDAHGQKTQQVVSMNHIVTHGGYRFYQNDYGTTDYDSLLSVNSDPWGIPVTYFGYALLFLSLAWVLFDPKGSYRQVLRSPQLLSGSRMARVSHRLWLCGYVFLLLAFVALTVYEVMRWISSGAVPMANAYESMLMLAWLIQLLTLCLCRRFRILLVFGILLSAFVLLATQMLQMSNQASPLMPVLRSPLLVVHVSVIMMSYALICLTFVCGVTALAIRLFRKQAGSSVASLAMLSRVFLYPALVTLAIGIFVGAIWANISWGTYWSWDPKETWALITFMVYGVAVHDRSFSSLQRPTVYHVYVTLAFLTLLMTYFGVNYFLGGMHSYA